MSNGAKMFDGDLNQLIGGMHDRDPRSGSCQPFTPEGIIKILKEEYLPMIAGIADIFSKATEAAQKPHTKEVFVTLADAYAAILFSLGCAISANCEKCAPEYKEAGLNVCARADAVTRLAHHIVTITETMGKAEKDQGSDPEPPPEAPAD